MKLHITAQSGPVMSHTLYATRIGPPQKGSNEYCYHESFVMYLFSPVTLQAVNASTYYVIF